MDDRSFQPPTASLNDCIQAVIDVAHAQHLRHSSSALGNVLRVHLGQAVLISLRPQAMLELLTDEPSRILLRLPGVGGHREQTVRCVRVARQALALYGLSPEAAHENRSELVYVGIRAYKLAADSAASHDRFLGDLWWELGTEFPRYGHVVGTSTRYITQ